MRPDEEIAFYIYLQRAGEREFTCHGVVRADRAITAARQWLDPREAVRGTLMVTGDGGAWVFPIVPPAKPTVVESIEVRP